MDLQQLGAKFKPMQRSIVEMTDGQNDITTAVLVLRELRPPLELGPAGQRLHRLAQYVLDLHAIERLDLDHDVLNEGTAKLSGLVQAYQSALAKTVMAVNSHKHLPGLLDPWRAVDNCQADTINGLVLCLYQHILQIPDLMKACGAFACSDQIQQKHPALAQLQHPDITSGDFAIAVLMLRNSKVTGNDDADLKHVLDEVEEVFCAFVTDDGAIQDRSQSSLFTEFRTYVSLHIALAQ